jgi:hypothetical protein
LALKFSLVQIGDLLAKHVNMQKLRRTMAVASVASLASQPEGLASLAYVTRHSFQTIKEYYDAFANVREGVIRSTQVTSSIFGVNPTSFRPLPFEDAIASLVMDLKAEIAKEDEKAVVALMKLTAAFKKIN